MTAAFPIPGVARTRNAVWTSLAYAATALGLTMLAIILGTLLWNGVGGLSLDVFTKNTAPPEVVGGLLNSIVGSVIMTGNSWRLAPLLAFSQARIWPNMAQIRSSPRQCALSMTFC